MPQQEVPTVQSPKPSVAVKQLQDSVCRNCGQPINLKLAKPTADSDEENVARTSDSEPESEDSEVLN